MIVTIISLATFFIEPNTRNFTVKYVFRPTGHACVKVGRVVRKPFQRPAIFTPVGLHR